MKWPRPHIVHTVSGWSPKLKYTLVDTEAKLITMRDQLIASPVIAYDTETSGLNPALGASICGHAFAARPDEFAVDAWYVPIRHVGPHNDVFKQLAVDVVSPAVDQVLTSPGGTVVTHHGKFERRMSRVDGIRITRAMRDVSIEATIDNENEQSFALKNLAAAYCFAAAKDEQEALTSWMRRDARQLGFAFKKRKKVTPSDIGEPTYVERFGYSRTPIDLCGVYGCKDVFYTLYLALAKYHRVAEVYPALHAREHGVSNLLHTMEWNGLSADEAVISDTHERTGQAVAHWLAKVRSHPHVPDDFQASDPELRNLFFIDMKLSPTKYTKVAKKPSVDKEARKLLAKQNPEHEELLDDLDHLATVQKLHSTYAGSYLRYYSAKTGRIHPSYNQLEEREIGGVPVTGRLSSADPNNQNVSGKTIHLWDCRCRTCVDEGQEAGRENTVSIRRYFLVPDGRVRVYIDFSQIELRVLTWLCQDPTLLNAYRTDLDVHQIIAGELGIKRSIAKQVNFGNSYGMSEIGLALRLPGYYDDPEGTRTLAKRILEAYFDRYKRIPQFRREFSGEMRRNGCKFVNPFGRPRRIPDIGAYERWKRERAERQMMSSIVSGTAADIMKESMLRCAGPDGVLERMPAPSGRKGELVQTIHDELVFDLPAEPGWPKTMLELKRNMEHWPMFSHPTDGRTGVPIKTSIEISTTNWEEKRGLEVLSDGTFRWVA
jgi:DNA polymerase-1